MTTRDRLDSYHQFEKEFFFHLDVENEESFLSKAFNAGYSMSVYLKYADTYTGYFQKNGLELLHQSKKPTYSGALKTFPAYHFNTDNEWQTYSRLRYRDLDRVNDRRIYEHKKALTRENLDLTVLHASACTKQLYINNADISITKLFFAQTGQSYVGIASNSKIVKARKMPLGTQEENFNRTKEFIQNAYNQRDIRPVSDPFFRIII